MFSIDHVDSQWPRRNLTQGHCAHMGYGVIIITYGTRPTFSVLIKCSASLIKSCNYITSEINRGNFKYVYEIYNYDIEKCERRAHLMKFRPISQLLNVRCCSGVMNFQKTCGKFLLLMFLRTDFFGAVPSINTYVYIHMHTYIHTYIHTYM